MWLSSSYEIAINMNVSIAQKKPSCKVCINVAFNLYEIAFEYKDECKDCSAKPSFQNLH